MRDSWKQWTLVSMTLVCGCELGVEHLEVGELKPIEEADSETSGKGDDGDGDGDGDAVPADECWAQGSSPDGDPDPFALPFPECEVECASGWGHGAEALPIDWTLDLGYEGDPVDYAHLGQLPNGQVLALLGLPGGNQLVFISPEGDIDDVVVVAEFGPKLWDMGIDGSGTIYALWDNDTEQSLTAISSAGVHLWTIDLGPNEIYTSVLAPLDEGVAVALNPADELGTSELVLVSPAGQTTSVGPIPFAWEMAVSPSGDTVVLADDTSVTWVDLDQHPAGMTSRGVADLFLPYGLVALDDTRIVGAGASPNWTETGTMHGQVHEIGPMGLVWEGHYDRAVAWCDAGPTDEGFTDVDRLADGSLLVVGGEASDPSVYQPWIGHVSADGEVLAMDRGFWVGLAVDALGGDDGSGYVLIQHNREIDGQPRQRLLVRKYLP